MILKTTRVEVSPPFKAKLYKIRGECEKFCNISRECGEKNFYRLVAVNLHNFTAEFSGEIT